jgi:hypothetical protein
LFGFTTPFQHDQQQLLRSYQSQKPIQYKDLSANEVDFEGIMKELSVKVTQNGRSKKDDNPKLGLEKKLDG